MSSIQFTILIRLPFTRGNFVDPQQATWDGSKDRELWRLVSRSPKTKNLDWVRLADEFKVPPAFLLQQAAWLYERHLDHVRAQMKKVGGHITAASPGVDNADATMGVVNNVGSIGPAVSKIEFVARPKNTQVAELQSRWAQDVAPGDSSAHVHPSTLPTLSRTPSTNTITQSRAAVQYTSVRNSVTRPRQNHKAPLASHLASDRPILQESLQMSGNDSSPALPTSSTSSSSLSNSDKDNLATRSQLFKRPPRFKSQSSRDLLIYGEDTADADESFQTMNTRFPFALPARQLPHAVREADRERQNETGTYPGGRSVNIEAKEGQPASGVQASLSIGNTARGPTRRDTVSVVGNPSPKHRTELARVSPKGTGHVARKDGSEGTPSMGSSFSDIDGTY